jgi:hypothetical protein
VRWTVNGAEHLPRLGPICAIRSQRTYRHFVGSFSQSQLCCLLPAGRSQDEQPFRLLSWSATPGQRHFSISRPVLRLHKLVRYLRHASWLRDGVSTLVQPVPYSKWTKPCLAMFHDSPRAQHHAALKPVLVQAPPQRAVFLSISLLTTACKCAALCGLSAQQEHGPHPHHELR